MRRCRRGGSRRAIVAHAPVVHVAQATGARLAIRLAAMCGIVGYVGPSVDGKALDVVMEGLARLEYRGYDSAGVALVDRGRRRLREARRQAGEPARRRSPTQPLPGVTHRHRAHPLGHPRRSHRRQRPPAPRRRRRPAGADPQRHHRELPRAARTSCSAEGVDVPLRDRHRGRRPPRRGRAYDRRGDLTEAMRSVVQPASRAPSPCSPCTPTARRRRRRPPQLPAGRRPRRRRELPRLRRRRLHRAHPRRARARPGPDRHDHPRRRRPVTDFDGTPGRGQGLRGRPGTPRPPRRAATTTFMEKEINEQPHAVADTLLGRTDDDGRLVLDELRISEERAARSRQDHHRRLRHRRLRRHGRQVRDRALDPDPGRGRAGPRVPLPRPDRRRAHAGRLDQPVRRDHGHPDGGQARPRAGRARPCRSATPTARPSRASPTRCSTPTPAPRSRSPRPRRSSPRSPPATCSGSTSPSCAAAPTPTRPRPS